MSSLVPNFSGTEANTSGALRNLLDANRAVTESYKDPVDRLERYAKEAEAKRILDEDRAFKLEDRLYSRAIDERNYKIAQEDRDYLLGQRKNKEDFMKSISEPGVDALDDTILKRTNELAASKWNEANPISDADAAKLNDYYVKNQKILNPTLDPENLRSYIGSQALKYGVDPSTATSTYEMFKPDKKETGLTDMEKLLIQNELGMQRDVNKLNAEKALGNEKYDGKSGSGGSGSSSRKNADGSAKNLAEVLADASKIKTEDSWMNALNPFVKSESEDVRDLAQKLYNENYDGKDIVNVLTSSVVDGKLDENRLKNVLKDVKIPVSKSDASSTTGALGKVEYKPAIDLQSMIAKGTKVDKGQLAEDMFEREFGIPKGKSGGSSSNDNESGRVPIVDKNGKVSRVEGVPDSLQLNEGLKLKAYDDAGGLAVGYGYNYSTKSTPELIKDFKQAGLSDYLLEDAAAGKKITLTKDEANRLAQVAYKNHGVNKADKLINNFDKLDPLMQEIASDMAYRGDLVPGENGYRGTLSNLLEQGDINKLYEYVDNSSKVPQAVKNRLGNILTVERDRPKDNIKDLFEKVKEKNQENTEINSDDKIKNEEINKVRQEILSKKEEDKKDNLYFPDFKPVIPSIRNKIAEDEKKLDNIKKEYESLSSKFKNDVSFDEYSKNKNIYDALYSSDYKK